MKFRLALPALALMVAAMAPAPTAHAQARVMSSVPAEGATVTRANSVTLTFAEAMSPATTAASIVMTAMPGVANHGEMVIRNFTVAWSDDNRTMTLSPRQPLRAGTYEIRWQASGPEGGRTSGTVNFTVG